MQARCLSDVPLPVGFRATTASCWAHSRWPSCPTPVAARMLMLADVLLCHAVSSAGLPAVPGLDWPAADASPARVVTAAQQTLQLGQSYRQAGTCTLASAVTVTDLTA